MMSSSIGIPWRYFAFRFGVSGCRFCFIFSLEYLYNMHFISFDIHTYALIHSRSSRYFCISFFVL